MVRTFIVTSILLFLFCFSVFADPPTSVSLTKTDGTTVSVTVRHISIVPDEHYVNRIEVKVNGQTVAEENLGPQNEKQFTAMLKVPSLEEGDKVEAIAYCDKWGQRSDWFTVKQKQVERKKATPIRPKTGLQ